MPAVETREKSPSGACGPVLSLRVRTVLIFVALIVFSTIATLVALGGLVATQYQEWEAGVTKEKAEVAAGVLRRIVGVTSRFAEDYGNGWDAFTTTVANPDSPGWNDTAFRALIDTEFINPGYLDVVAVFSPSGRLLHAVLSNATAEFPAGLRIALAIPATRERAAKGGIDGAFSFGGSDMYVGSLRAIHDRSTPTVYGWLIFAVLVRTKLDDVAASAQGCVSVRSTSGATGLAADAVAALEDGLTDDMGNWAKHVYVSRFKVSDEGHGDVCPTGLTDHRNSFQNAGFIIISDAIYENSSAASSPLSPGSALFRVTHQRLVMESGAAMLVWLLVLVIVLMALFGAAMAIFVEVDVLRRLKKIQLQLMPATVRTRRGSSVSEDGTGQDEIGRLELLLRYRLKLMVKELKATVVEGDGEKDAIGRLESASRLLNILGGRDVPFPSSSLLAATTPSAPEASSSELNVEALMRDPLAVEFLKWYMSTNGDGVGPILLILDYFALVDEPSASMRVTRAARIYNRFFSSTAYYAVEFDAGLRQPIKGAIKANADAAAVSLIGAAVEGIVNTVVSESLTNLLLSKELPHLLLILKECSKQQPDGKEQQHPQFEDTAVAAEKTVAPDERGIDGNEPKYAEENETSDITLEEVA